MRQVPPTVIPSAISAPTPEAEAAAVASDQHALESLRVEAIQRLINCRTQEIAGVLMRLIDEDQPQAVQDAAFEALAKLTGTKLSYASVGPARSQTITL